jgi:hypothetical protein
MEALPQVLAQRDRRRRAVMWLDGHFSGSRYETARAQLDTPVLRELDTALFHAGPGDLVRAPDQEDPEESSRDRLAKHFLSAFA